MVGGGPTGVELAGALAEISRHALANDFRAIDPESARIILIEGGPAVLSAYPEPLSDFARRALERLGVAVWTGSVVTGVEAGQVHVGGETIEAGTILWAAGVSASPLGATLGAPLDRAGRVLVNDDLTFPAIRRSYVVGRSGGVQDGETAHWLPGVAQVAMQQAAHAARNVARARRRTSRRSRSSTATLATWRRSAATPRSADMPGSG